MCSVCFSACVTVCVCVCMCSVCFSACVIVCVRVRVCVWVSVGLRVLVYVFVCVRFLWVIWVQVSQCTFPGRTMQRSRTCRTLQNPANAGSALHQCSQGRGFTTHPNAHPLMRLQEKGFSFPSRICAAILDVKTTHS